MRPKAKMARATALVPICISASAEQEAARLSLVRAALIQILTPIAWVDCL
jgi:hypothetical protein